jgi:hypothetical protein
LADASRTALEKGGGDPAWREAVRKEFPEAVLEKDGRWWVRADVAHYNRFVHDKVAEELAKIINP